jgi:hypothetical protein
MTVVCQCNHPTNGTTFITKDECKECNDACVKIDAKNVQCIDTCLLYGVSIAMVMTSLIVLILMIWFSIHVMKKCKGKPKWLNPVIITLLVLWILIGWVPPLGFLLFIILLVILIMYNKKR